MGCGQSKSSEEAVAETATSSGVAPANYAAYCRLDRGRKMKLTNTAIVRYHAWEDGSWLAPT
eukprot:scaffold611099_cov75-Attheya_sp.AAC.1